MDQRKRDWRRRINLETFSIASVRACVLGQNYGSFNAGMEALGIGRTGAAEHGFIWPQGQVDNDELIRALDEAWRFQIGKRAVTDGRHVRRADPAGADDAAVVRA